MIREVLSLRHAKIDGVPAEVWRRDVGRLVRRLRTKPQPEAVHHEVVALLRRATPCGTGDVGMFPHHLGPVAHTLIGVLDDYT